LNPNAVTKPHRNVRLFLCGYSMAPARSAGNGYERGVAAGISKRLIAMSRTR